MAKKLKTELLPSNYTVTIALVLTLIGWRVSNYTGTFFGIPNNQLTNGTGSIAFLGFVIVVYAFWLLFNRKKLTLLGLQRSSGYVAAILLIFTGIKFASVGVGEGQMLHDDGYSITGAVMTLIGGLIIGWLYSTPQKQANKLKVKG